jgi:hypothetical protein
MDKFQITGGGPAFPHRIPRAQGTHAHRDAPTKTVQIMIDPQRLATTPAEAARITDPPGPG